ncbi:hypothetical protein FGSG_11979 [Fusarium graminearum PH-1]|uniref:protein-tyrosine-phosphatase n=1 Tax=Gibberella zeae (strain ATCC MYA-4620 / CBS 123657 / FGSC 9075 / NRRL 31084 / PH-1) TaxID=229533 RepID=I1S561_GIBZE|nr:hypothetical protein FGSG_11979 [Fusarium graminearum PH-1]ESU06942.1 hypothetical protein FGSG_11979 [Fusarium graminearum PH-1]|eukprot:XP_011317427.1 hypothetical protein FGSG_11979 [Fusarium graminearum PH-1]
MKTPAQYSPAGQSHSNSISHSRSNSYNLNHSHSHSHSQSLRPNKQPKTSTPLASPRMPYSVNQNHPPPKSSPRVVSDDRSPSPNYFGLIVESANEQGGGSSGVPNDNWSPSSSDSMQDSAYVSSDSNRNSESSFHHNVPALHLPRFESPLPMDPPQHRTSLTRSEDRDPRLSVMEHRPEPPDARDSQRSATLPATLEPGQPHMITGQQLKDMLRNVKKERLLLLDLRSSQNYAQSRIEGALNLCIPTTLLKRATFNIQKLKQTFQSSDDSDKFDTWNDTDYIVVYDAHASDKRDAITAQNMIKKFTNEGYTGGTCILKGGFNSFQQHFSDFVDNQSANGAPGKPGPGHGGIAPVIGGVMLPNASNDVNPFFSNIRQNMDLADGVGQLDVSRPTALDSPSLPRWLREAAAQPDHGKKVSDKFLHIEVDEQSRMKAAYAAFNPHNQDKRSQDFWSVIWQEDVRVVVMLTAETEGGQLKCHPYWKGRDFGAIRLKLLSEKKVSLDIDKHRSDSNHPSSTSASEAGRKRANTTTTLEASNQAPRGAQGAQTEAPYVILRKFALSHTSHPFAPIREITHLHFPSWPDFGTPAQPSHLLALVELANVMQRSALPVETSQISKISALEPPAITWYDEPEVDSRARPILVHCSAGCGRTGTFCTVDSVIDMLKRQRQAKMDSVKARDYDGDVSMGENTDASPRSAKHSNFYTPGQRSNMERKAARGGAHIDTDWVHDDSVDLIQKTVEDFREQRLSMVQSLRQYVLCYETVLDITMIEFNPGGV